MSKKTEIFNMSMFAYLKQLQNAKITCVIAVNMLLNISYV